MIFDMTVADRIGGRTTAALRENGQEGLSWQLNSTVIDGPAAWEGRDLRRLSMWKAMLDPGLALRAMMLRRTVHVSGARSTARPVTVHAADMGPSREGACFTYQPSRSREAVRSEIAQIDFSRTTDKKPLQEFWTAIIRGRRWERRLTPRRPGGEGYL